MNNKLTLVLLAVLFGAGILVIKLPFSFSRKCCTVELSKCRRFLQRDAIQSAVMSQYVRLTVCLSVCDDQVP